jgi:ABC-type molybdate transport system substrate-binding protein
VYTAAVCTKARSQQEARDFVQLLSSADNAATRRQCGFEALP